MMGGVSSGDEDLYQQVLNEAESIPSLDFIGFVPTNEVDSHFNGSKVFVNTSDSEGFPNTFLQSWAHRIPTISFMDCGARVNGNPVGRIADSPQMLAEMTRRLMTSDEQWHAGGIAGQKYFEQHNSVETVVDLCEGILSRLLGQRSMIELKNGFPERYAAITLLPSTLKFRRRVPCVNLISRRHITACNGMKANEKN